MVSSTGSYLGQSSRSDKTARMTVDRSFQQFTMKIPDRPVYVQRSRSPP
jgi:hypothetical protein